MGISGQKEMMVDKFNNTNSSLKFTPLNGLTLPSTSKLKYFECGISNFVVLDMTTSTQLISFIFKDNNLIQIIDLSMCPNLGQIKINVSNTLNLLVVMPNLYFFVISTLPLLTTLTIPISPYSTFSINNTGLLNVVFNSDVSVSNNCRIDILNNTNLVNINLNLATRVNVLYVISNTTLTSFTLPSTHITQYRSSGVNISGNYILPSTNVMIKVCSIKHFEFK